MAANDEQQSVSRRQVDEASHGNVKNAIWHNTGTKGDFYSASTPTILYKDDAGEFKDGSNFGRHDLPDLAEAAREAAMKIRDLQKAQNRGH